MALRLYGLDWDQMQARYQFLLHLYGVDFAQGNNFHPDERQILFHVVQLSWPNSVAQFLNVATSPLNPHFFAYGSFPLYLLASVGNILSHISPALANFANLTLTGRVLNALFDTGTILLTGWLGLLLTNDRTPGRRYAWLVALVMRWYKHGLSSIFVSLLLSTCSTLLVFLIAMPYALLDLPEFIQQVSAQGDLARGALDLPYVRQFAGTTPYVYEAQNMLFWGMGLKLGLAALAGFLWLCWH